MKKSPKNVAVQAEPLAQPFVFVEESPEARFARVQRELAEEEKSKQVPFRPVECDNKLNVPPLPPPGRVITGSSLTYRQAIEQGLISYAELPVGMPVDAAYEPIAQTNMATQPQNRPLTHSEIGEWQREQQSNAERLSKEKSQRGRCPNCGANITPGVAYHRLEVGDKSSHAFEFVTGFGVSEKLCVIDPERTARSGRVSRIQLKEAGLL